MYSDAMPLIIPPGYGQAVYTMQLTGDSEPMVVTCGHGLAFWGGDFQSAVNRLQQDFVANIGPIMPSSYLLDFTTLYAGDDSGTPTVWESEAAGTPGGASSSNTLPQNCALLVSKRTGLAGRRGRGRLYLPGQPEAGWNELGDVQGTWGTNTQDAFDAWMADLTSTGPGFEPNPPYILHRSEGAGTEPAPTEITAMICSSKLATQRKRLRK